MKRETSSRQRGRAGCPLSQTRVRDRPVFGRDTAEPRAGKLLDAPPENTLKGKRDRAILATLLYHGIRREELCRLRVKTMQNRQGVVHFRMRGKRDNVRFPSMHCRVNREGPLIL